MGWAKGVLKVSAKYKYLGDLSNVPIWHRWIGNINGCQCPQCGVGIRGLPVKADLNTAGFDAQKKMEH